MLLWKVSQWETIDWNEAIPVKFSPLSNQDMFFFLQILLQFSKKDHNVNLFLGIPQTQKVFSLKTHLIIYSSSVKAFPVVF